MLCFCLIVVMPPHAACSTHAYADVTCNTCYPSADEARLQALERIAGLLEGAGGSLTLNERGDAAALTRHPDFRLMAAMNPATDVGEPCQLHFRPGTSMLVTTFDASVHCGEQTAEGADRKRF